MFNCPLFRIISIVPYFSCCNLPPQEGHTGQSRTDTGLTLQKTTGSPIKLKTMGCFDPVLVLFLLLGYLQNVLHTTSKFFLKTVTKINMHMTFKTEKDTHINNL